MGIAITHPIAKGLAIAVGIAQVGWHLLAAGFAHTLEGIKEAQHAVALLGPRQVERRLGQGVEALRQAHPLKGRRTGFHHHHRLGIGQADVFAGGDQHAAEDKAGVFAGLHHAGQPEEGRIRIGAPQRLYEGTDCVEVGIPLLVVEHRPLLD